MPVKTLRNASPQHFMVGSTERLLDNEEYCTPCGVKPIAHPQSVLAATGHRDFFAGTEEMRDASYLFSTV